MARSLPYGAARNRLIVSLESLSHALNRGEADASCAAALYATQDLDAVPVNPASSAERNVIGFVLMVTIAAVARS